MLNFLINLQQLVKKVKNVSIKIDKHGDYDYFYIISDAFEITIFYKDKSLSDMFRFFIELYESRKHTQQ